MKDTANMPITYDGETKTVREWCREMHLNYATVRMRYLRGDRGAKLLKPTRPPVRPVDLQVFFGYIVYNDLAELAEVMGMTPMELTKHIVPIALAKLRKQLEPQ